MSDTDASVEYDVVRNDEEQYSIWATGRPVPAGWHPMGVRGTRAHCLDWVEQNWTDTAPRSLRGATGA